ncbi:MAG: hypothetical protein WA066_02595, partial [Candidatus Omnitrophota bacterium]
LSKIRNKKWGIEKLLETLGEKISHSNLCDFDIQGYKEALGAFSIFKLKSFRNKYEFEDGLFLLSHKELGVNGVVLRGASSITSPLSLKGSSPITQGITRRQFMAGLAGWALLLGIPGFLFASSDPNTEIDRWLRIMEDETKPESERIKAAKGLYEFFGNKHNFVPPTIVEHTLDKDINYKLIVKRVLKVYLRKESLWDLKVSVSELLGSLTYHYRKEYLKTFSYQEQSEIAIKVNEFSLWFMEPKMRDEMVKATKGYPYAIFEGLAIPIWHINKQMVISDAPNSIKLPAIDSFLTNIGGKLWLLLQSTYGPKEIYSFQVANAINALHDLGPEGEALRRQVTLQAKPQAVFNLLTYAGHELYTSSFNLLFQRLTNIVKEQYNGSLYAYMQDIIPNLQQQRQFVLSLIMGVDVKSFVQKDAKFADFLENMVILETLEKMTSQDTDDIILAIDLIEKIFLNWQGLDIKQRTEKILLNLLNSKDAQERIIAQMLIEKLGPYFGPANKTKLQDISIPKRLANYQYPKYKEWIRNNTLTSYVNFLQSANGYLKELRDLLLRQGYHVSLNGVPEGVDRKYIKHILEKKINGITSKVILAFNADEKEMKRVIEHPDIALVHTQHHSFEEDKTIGVGSEKVLPYFILTRNVAQGTENNYLFTLLIESLAKGSKDNWSWQEISKYIQPRITKTIQNYVFPDSLLVLIRQFLVHAKDKNSQQASLSKLLFPGGCGSFRRVSGLSSNYNMNYPFPTSSSPVIRMTEVIRGIFIATTLIAVPVNLTACVVFGPTIHYEISLVLGIIVAGLFVIITFAAKLISLMHKEEEAASPEKPVQENTASSPIEVNVKSKDLTPLMLVDKKTSPSTPSSSVQLLRVNPAS